MMCLPLRSMILPIALTSITLSSAAFADVFELQDGYRSAARHHWRGNEFSLHYLTHETQKLSYGAYFSNSTFRINQEKRGQLREFGPELRYTLPVSQVSSYLGVQYAFLSDGSYTIDQHDVGAKVLGPRISLGALYPLESLGLILSFGLSKGWERLYTHSDRHTENNFGSHSLFVGVSL